MDSMDLQNISLDSIQKFIVTNKPLGDLLWHLLVYLPLLLDPKGVSRHFTSSKFAGYLKLPWIPLLAHIVIGLILVGRYQFKALTSAEPPMPDIFDIALGFTNGILGWRLCKYENVGNPHFARGGFQFAAVMVLFATLMCYWTSGPVWYHALAKIHNAFVYVRWLLRIGRQFRLYSSVDQAYTISIWFGALLGIMEGKWPWDGILGVPLGLVIQFVLVIVERKISSLITLENSKSNPFLRLMLLIGLVEVGTYKKLKEPVAESGHSQEVADTKN